MLAIQVAAKPTEPTKPTMSKEQACKGQPRAQQYVGRKVDNPVFLQPPQPLDPSVAHQYFSLGTLCARETVVVSVGCAVDLRMPLKCKPIAAPCKQTFPQTSGKRGSITGTKRSCGSAFFTPTSDSSSDSSSDVHNHAPNHTFPKDELHAAVAHHVQTVVLKELWCEPKASASASAAAQKAAHYPLYEDTRRARQRCANHIVDDAQTTAPLAAPALDRFLRLPRAYGLAAFAGAPALEGWHAKMVAKLKPAPNLQRFVGTLRPYQQDAVDHVVTKLQQLPCHSGILQGDCGCGKTLMGFHLMHRIGLPCIVLVHTGVLLEQWRERLSETLPEAKVGILRGAKLLRGCCEVAARLLRGCNQLLR